MILAAEESLWFGPVRVDKDPQETWINAQHLLCCGNLLLDYECILSHWVENACSAEEEVLISNVILIRGRKGLVLLDKWDDWLKSSLLISE